MRGLVDDTELERIKDRSQTYMNDKMPEDAFYGLAALDLCTNAFEVIAKLTPDTARQTLAELGPVSANLDLLLAQFDKKSSAPLLCEGSYWAGTVLGSLIEQLDEALGGRTS